jgi:YHS domain-containing protein
VYFCCPGCIETFKKDPAKYLKKMQEAGEEPEVVKK